MRLIQTFYTEHEALSWISNQPTPKRGGYFVDRDIFSGKFQVYLMD